MRLQLQVLGAERVDEDPLGALEEVGRRPGLDASEKPDGESDVGADLAAEVEQLHRQAAELLADVGAGEARVLLEAGRVDDGGEVGVRRRLVVVVNARREERSAAMASMYFSMSRVTWPGVCSMCTERKSCRSTSKLVQSKLAEKSRTNSAYSFESFLENVSRSST